MDGITIYFIEDVQRHLSVGIDLFFFTTQTSRLRGIKLLDKGTHFLHCSDYTNNCRFGLFIVCEPGDLFVVNIKEDAFEVVLVADSHGKVVDGVEFFESDMNLDDSVDNINLSKYRGEVLANLAYLLNYSQFDNSQWRGIVGDVTWDQVRQIIPKGTTSRKVSGAVTTTDSSKQENDSLLLAIRDASRNRTEKSAAYGNGQEDKILSSLKEDVNANGELVFFPIDLKKTIRPNATVVEVTHDYLDKSWYLQNVVCKQTNFLAEFEISFVFMMILNNFNSYRQWMNLMLVVLGCVDAVTENPGFFLRVIKIWKSQLELLPEEIVDDGMSNSGLVDLKLLAEPMGHFKSAIQSSGMPEFDYVVRLMRSKFSVELVESEDDDDESDYQSNDQNDSDDYL
ncbi:unnamed protein product [Kuraishia capsulata CBS 1993]|uniref:A1 cistron-splicing factor AAR2 n=1 Tax=Kuraishia capsulata CBS 1993 TaxID=1382522 RepID=W6MTF5_9ASCO|nr:uncharacterized protein KUCA_T00004470001 [Kuraishia capsulata CBS 1993]CDK28487.1 unnamed protein product [Kuraishia capsulata CBS 1993]